VEEDRNLTPEEAVVFLHVVTEKTLRNWRWLTKKLGRQIGPKFIRIGRRIAYRLSDLKRYLLVNES
jgi:hypothetical protein